MKSKWFTGILPRDVIDIVVVLFTLLVMPRLMADEFRYSRAVATGIQERILGADGKETVITFSGKGDAEAGFLLTKLLEPGGVSGTTNAEMRKGAFFDQTIILSGTLLPKIHRSASGPDMTAAESYQEFIMDGLKIRFPFVRHRQMEAADSGYLETHFAFDTLFPEGLEFGGKSIDFRKYTAKTEKREKDHAAAGLGPFTREQALKIGADNGGVGNGKFWFEDGDASPPFVHAGHIEISPGNEVFRKLNGDPYAGSMADAPHDDGSLTRVDFFTSSNGKGWIAVHVLKPEVEPAKKKAAVDNRPEEHLKLASAGELAVFGGDMEFLALLLSKGLEINLPIDSESGDTLLHKAVDSGQPGTVEFLLRKGADRGIRNHYGSKPIKYAISRKDGKLCKLLEVSEEKAPVINGVPAGLIEQLLWDSSRDEPTFITWNGKDPDQELLAEIRKTIPHARPASGMVTLERRPLGAETWYQDKESKEFGQLVEVTAEKDKEGKIWNVSVRKSAGPVMAGGGRRAKMREEYGCWTDFDHEFWAE